MGNLLKLTSSYGSQAVKMDIPPWVGSLLFVENIECVRAGTENSDAEGNDKACEDSLRKVERCRVDLHPGEFTIMLV
jgi:hypothetical protein